MRRLKTVRRPPIYPKTPGHLPCSSLTHPLPLSSRRPSVSFGGFGLTSRGLGDTLAHQVVPPTRRQMGGAVTDAPDDAFGQQAGQGAVDGRAGLAEDVRQFRRIDERHPAEEVEQLSIGE